MKSSVGTLLVVIAMVTTTITHAQVGSSFDLQTLVEELFTLQEEDVNYEDLYENLLLLYQNPLNINTATKAELHDTYLLSNQQIINLLSYIEEKGALVTPYELLVIEGFDAATIRKILPFFVVDWRNANRDNRPLLQRILTERNNYLITRYERTLEDKRGYREPLDPSASHYQGSPDKLYLRYRVAKLGDFSLGFTVEKDAGEAFVLQPLQSRFGMDFWSAHVMLEKKGRIQKLVIGDYQLQLGQGLIFGAGFSVGKGSETINTTRRNHLGIRPYTSVLETGFLRGMASTIKVNSSLSLTGFISGLKQDASIQESESEKPFFTSIRTSGLHRTQSEIESRNSIKESVYGLNANLNPSRNFSLGATVAFNRFNLYRQPGDELYRKFEFQGSSNFNAGIYADLYWQGFSMFGEAASSKSGGLAGVIGLSKQLSPRFQLALILRSYAKDFHSIQGAAFGENSRNINEEGTYWGIKYTFNSKLSLSAYYDTFRFPWLKFRTNSPSVGQDYLIRLNYRPHRNVKLYWQVRGKTKGVNSPGADERQTLVLPGRRKQHILSMALQANAQLSLNSRIQWSNYRLNETTTKGIALVQDATYSLQNWSLSGRVAFFDTNGIENRQYVYEKDVLYAFSIPGYSGRGVRNYVLLSYQLSSKIDLWARFSRTTFYDRSKIGTGLETIDGDKRTEVKFQMRYRLN